MEPNKPKFNAGDFFLNLGAVVALYTTVFSLLRVLFVAIDNKYPRVSDAYGYYNASISWPVAVLIIFFPIFITLMWILGKQYTSHPEKKNTGIHKFLTYLTLFISGLVLAGDLIAVLYYFIDGQELTTAFLLKVLVLFVITGGVFMYYLSDIRGKLTEKSRTTWRLFAIVLVLGSIIWGFSVLGSPRTQRLYKYDDQKINDLQILKAQVEAYYGTNSKLPVTLKDLSEVNYGQEVLDNQTGLPYEYQKTGDMTYSLCATFNKSSKDNRSGTSYPYFGDVSWTHPVGKHCFSQKINPLMYPKPQMVR